MTATILRAAIPPRAPLIERGGSSWRPLLRLAARDVRRRKGRTALIALMIGIPVGIMLTVAAQVRTGELTPEQRRTLDFGQATGIAYLPTTSTIDVRDGVTIEQRGGRIEVDGQRKRVILLDGAIGDPLFEGKYELLNGRLPSTAAEITVSSHLADELDLAIGDVATIRPSTDDLTVVGVFRDRSFATSDGVAIAPGAFVKHFSQGSQTFFRTDGAMQGLSPENVYRPQAADYAYYDDRVDSIAVLYTVGAVALIALGLIIVAAFASGARRQLRELGLIAANGGDPRQIRRALALAGTATGVIGVLVGYGLFAIAMVVLAPHQDSLAGHVVPGIKVAPFDLVAIGLMGTLAATFAAWLPARSAARTPVLAALGGRAPLPPVRARLPLFGLLLATAGLFALASSLAATAWFPSALSGIAILLGGAMCAPWLVALLAGVASRFGGATRLAARRIARHRSRTGPLVASIMAVIGAVIATGVAVESAAAQDRRNTGYGAANVVTIGEGGFGIGPQNPGSGLSEVPSVSEEYRQAKMSELRSLLPGATTVDLRMPQLDDAGLGMNAPGFLAVARSESLRSLGAPLAADILDDDGYVLLFANDSNRPTSLDVFSNSEDGQTGPVRSTPIDPRTSDERPPLGFGYYVLDPEGTPIETVLILSDRYFEEMFGRSFEDILANLRLVAPSDLTNEQRAEIERLNEKWQDEAYDAAAIDGYAPSLYAYASGAPTEYLNWARLGMMGAALLLALAVVAIGLTLSSVEQRDDEATLIAIGASPSVRRRVRAAEAGTLTAMGAFLGLPLGATAGIIIALNETYDRNSLRFPWLVAFAVCVALPATAGGVTWLFTRTPRRIELNNT